MNENKKKLWNLSTAVLRRKFISIKPYVQNEGRSQYNLPTLKKLVKSYKLNPIKTGEK